MSSHKEQIRNENTTRLHSRIVKESSTDSLPALKVQRVPLLKWQLKDPKAASKIEGND
jgi:hypothetical protein